MARVIFHVDVNNAFLSWTAVYLLKQGFEKDIRKIPSVIALDDKSRRGIVLAKSPVAKKYGIITAETLYSARCKCNILEVFPPNYEIYKGESKKLYDYLATYTPIIEQYSIDECFLDLTGTSLLYGSDYELLAHKIKDEIKEKFGFTVNIGIGENKLCAKMASDFEKPDRVHTLYLREIKTKMWPLKVNDLFMLGKSSSKKLNDLGIYTIKDLALADINLLKKHFKSQGEYFKKAALGIDDSIVEGRGTKNKCLSISRTLPHDVIEKEKLLKILFNETLDLSFTLRGKKLYTTTVAVTYKNNLFRSYSHQITLSNPTNVAEEIYKGVKLAFESSWREDAIRSIGIRLGDLSENVVSQISLFEHANVKTNDKVEEVMDKIIEKYGKDSIIRASWKELE